MNGSSGTVRCAAASLLVILSFVACLARAEIKVGLSDWPGWVAWYIAEEKGFFKKYGADVKLVWFATYTDSISALSAGQLDANSQTWADTMVPLAKGVPLKVVLVNDNSAGNDALMVNPKITSFKGLRGKTVALEEFSVSHFVLVIALARHGMSQKDVKIVNLDAGDAAAAFLAGRVDAVVVWNPWVNQIQTSGKGKALFTSKDMPGLIPDLLVAQEKSIEANRKDYIGMIKAWYETEKFIQDKPDEAAAIMANAVSMEGSDYRIFLPGIRFFTQKDNLEAFGPASKPHSLLGVAPTIVKFLADNRLIEGKADPTHALDGSLVREVAR
jgi:NitT/TauT family transport system substrate-binding protein